MDDLRQQLQQRFGLDEFRPSQREVIEDILSGRDVLCVMPTGAGKSLCYQLPAVVRGGLTVVVSPLISLMEDQVQQLRDEGINAALLNSSLTPAMQREAIAQIRDGFEGLLYVAPERFYATTFEPLIRELKVALLAIDEAHCISIWGHDFRPEYQMLGAVREKMGSPPCIALTATATEDVRADIIHGLELREPSITVTGFDRPNLSYQVRSISKVKLKDEELLRLLKDVDGSAIVYCSTRKAVDSLAPFIAGEFRDRVVVGYHAGLDQDKRTANQERFMQSDRSIAVATNAFGMGIDKPDIRLVVHYNMPGTLEAYYQEAGRAGRDGLPARAVLLYSFQDRITQEFFIDKIGENGDDAEMIARLKARATDKLELLVRYAQTHTCRRQQILDYFGDESEIGGCACDLCASAGAGAWTADIEVSEETTTLVRQILSGVARLRGKFGVGVVAEVLTGVRDERTERWRLDQLTVFGLLKQYPTKRVIAMVHRVMEAGLARQKDVGEPGKRIYVVDLTASGIAVMKGQHPVPTPLADLIAPARQRSRASGTRSRVVPATQAAEVALDSDASHRFDRLRAARAELAREHSLPAYCICHDSTLKLIAANAPSSLSSLESIKGMGPHKVRMYGQHLLAALNGDA